MVFGELLRPYTKLQWFPKTDYIKGEVCITSLIGKFGLVSGNFKISQSGLKKILWPFKKTKMTNGYLGLISILSRLCV